MDGGAEMVKHNMQQWMVGRNGQTQHAAVDGGPRWSNTTCSSGWWAEMVKHNMQYWMVGRDGQTQHAVLDGGPRWSNTTYSSGWWGQDGQTQHAAVDGEAEMVKHNMQQWMVGVKMVK